MGRHHTRRCSENLRNHPLLIAATVFLLTVSHSPMLKSCRFVRHLKNHMRCGEERVSSLKGTSWSDPQDSRCDRLVREEQFNVSDFRQFKIATHESSMSYQET